MIDSSRVVTETVDAELAKIASMVTLTAMALIVSHVNALTATARLPEFAFVLTCTAVFVVG